jgi:excisionase family DNA binding protein
MSGEFLTAADLVAHPERIADVAPTQIPTILAQLTTLTAALAARSALPSAPSAASEQGDRLLTVKEAAALLQMSVDFLRRSPVARPLRVRVGRELRFSARAIDAFIERRTGRE